MAESQAGAASKLYTLTEVSQETGISMPTLQRYKKMYQDRIPSEGSGRSQRYPQAALDVFLELKDENVKKRGRPRKTPRDTAAEERRPTASKRPRGRKPGGTSKAATKPASAASAAPEGELLTLTEIGKVTGISYPTLLRYVKSNSKDIPHKGSGRGRRYMPEAVGVFERLRGESRRGRQSGKGADTAGDTPKKGKRGRPRKSAGRPPGPGRPPASGGENSDLVARIKELEKLGKQLERSLEKLEKRLEKPLRVVLQRS